MSVSSPDAGVIFDLDGTLVASEPIYFGSTEEILAPLGRSLDELTPEERSRIPGRSAVENMAWIKEKYGLDGTPEGLMARRMESIVARVEREGVALLPGAGAFLGSLADAGFRLALASSSSGRYVRKVLDRTGLARFFEVVRTGDDCTRFKPDPEIFLMAAAGLGVESCRCVVVEDSHAGILAAKAAGMKVIGVANEITLPGQIALADRVVHDFTGLAAGDVSALLDGIGPP